MCICFAAYVQIVVESFMRFSPSFLDDIRQRLPVSQVVSQRVQLKRRGREYVGLSPFKVEKTPSFTVNDQKGFYHCFATGEHGDIFTFVMKTQGLSFFEAVEQLAGLAGVPMPVATPDMQKQENERERLFMIMEAATQYFVDALHGALGRSARDYLDFRKVPERACHNFRLGYAANNRTALKSYLRDAGFHLDEMIKAGLVIGGDDIAVPYDRFRHRIMFPITDLKGRVIAFGGRAMDPDHPAKYLNSPETPLFHKGQVLFNAVDARQSAFDDGNVVVVEGYMDVIALVVAGFENVVAPLGTALTERQLQLLWRMVDEPILCFDGDAAGRKAAYRAVEMALPHLRPGKSLCFAFLPDGQDPDDLLQSHGGDAMREVLSGARSLAEVLWSKEWETGRWDTPERRAALESQVLKLVDQISDLTVRRQYSSEMKRRIWEAWRSNYGNQFAGHRAKYKASSFRSGFSGSRKGRHDAVLSASDSLVNSPLVAQQQSRLNIRESLLLLTVVNHPWLLDEYAEQISELSFENKMLQEFRDCLLEAHSIQNSLDIAAIRTHLNHLGHEKTLAQIERAITHKGDSFVLSEAAPAKVEAGWRHLLALHHKLSELQQDLELATRAFEQDESEENYVRLCNIRRELLSAEGTEVDMSGYEETVGVFGSNP